MERPETIYKLVSLRLVVEEEHDAMAQLYMDTPDAYLNVAKSLLKDRDRVQVLAMHLDSANTLMSAEVTTVGGPTGCYIAPSALFRSALVAGAAKVVFVIRLAGHLRPVKSVEPELAHYLLKAARTVGIEMVDLVVFTRMTWVSLKTMFPDLPWHWGEREGLTFELDC